MIRSFSKSATFLGTAEDIPRFLHTQYVQTEWNEGGRVVLLGLEFPELAFHSDSGPTLHQLFLGRSREIQFHLSCVGRSAQFHSLLDRKRLPRRTGISCQPLSKVVFGTEEDHVVRACVNDVVPPFGRGHAQEDEWLWRV